MARPLQAGIPTEIRHVAGWRLDSLTVMRDEPDRGTWEDLPNRGSPGHLGGVGACAPSNLLRRIVDGSQPDTSCDVQLAATEAI